MELYQLEYVLALANYQNFSKAAGEINVSQSAFSHGIKKLEKQLGVELFVRNKKSVALTEAGEEFVIYAQRILDEVKKAQNAMLEHAKSLKGTIKIGAIPAITYQGITAVLSAFQTKYPGIKLEIIEDRSSVLAKKFDAKELNAIIVNWIELTDKYKPYSYPLIKDKIVFLVSRDHWLAAKECVSLADLTAENFVMVTPFRNDFTKLCLSVGFKPSITAVSPQSISIKKFVEQNLGIAPCTSYVAAALLSPKTKIVHFTPLVERTTYLIIEDNSAINTTLKNFILSSPITPQYLSAE